MPPRPRTSRPARAGFTLVELLAAMTIGLVVLAAATGFALNTWRVQSRGTANEDVTRRGRYVSTSLQRDVGEVGVLIPSSPRFGTVLVFNDTLAMIRVPTRDTVVAPEYLLAWDTASPPAPGTGTCGASCFEVRKRNGRVELEAGDLVLIRDSGSGSRRLLITSAVNDPTPTDTLGVVRITVRNDIDTLFRWPSGLDSTITVQASSLQRVSLAAYYRDSTNLFRATRFDDNGDFVPEVLAPGVVDWQVRAVFNNGTEADSITPSDTLQDFCQVASVRAIARFTADRPADPRVANQVSAQRPYNMTYVARNLVYQRNARRGRPCI
jgi:prepilin-type N-terminal cleavage/methylation domain-containing protein